AEPPMLTRKLGLAETKILIAAVDEVADFVEALLVSAGFQNVQRRPEDVEEFLRTYRPGEYGLIISQPSGTYFKTKDGLFMDGLMLLSEVRKRDGKAKFLVVSGGPGTAVQKRCNDLELCDYTYWGMSCVPDQLLRAVDRALSDHHESATNRVSQRR
ncbi:MAG: hypothetical protein NT154_32885, partial [Verrucomicrobia bacterium]|nr:hypothetical protein [Verrucomicrobiota bacterium]